MHNTNDRYFLDLKSILKTNFHLFCHLINPQNVMSLRFCDDEHTSNQIGLFISLIRLRQFARLDSIIFLGIGEFQLNIKNDMSPINLILLINIKFKLIRYQFVNMFFNMN
ncbi:unnamed protein product [Rotaria sp. Silwood2]|nr:unnamed protein product [Rotaria sp. Silwood2]CAF3518307.1 unnamed protein product [Rotaria sp. Silwood2]CAF4380478.1 unnamed protein product [Rotaria sp. Silwood2]